MCRKRENFLDSSGRFRQNKCQIQKYELFLANLANKFRISDWMYITQMAIQNVFPRKSFMALMALKATFLIFQMALCVSGQRSLSVKFLWTFLTTIQKITLKIKLTSHLHVYYVPKVVRIHMPNDMFDDSTSEEVLSIAAT